ncbi:hypothetical protein [Amycolatopsis sp. NPDC059657]|uniref:hypothetical protein n=1 Tax=Amycolatopsis sp. NPDC059657 TaxID=3346899 RepID=UPI00366CE30B
MTREPNPSSEPTPWAPPSPRELPALREHLSNYLRSVPAHLLTAELLRRGRGTLRPAAADPDDGAALLLEDERQRLSRARLYYVTSDITKLVRHAARNLKDTWDIQPEDLPALTGFMLFAEPIAEYLREDDGTPVRIVAVSWGQTKLMSDQHGGLWLTFWSVTNFAGIISLARALGVPASEAERQARIQHAELTWDNEIYLPWGLTQAAVPEPRDFDVRIVDPTTLAAAKTTIDWLRVVHAGWIFCQPNTFTDVAEQPLRRTMRRRAEQAGLAPSTVRVVSVSQKTRPRAAKPAEPSGRSVGVRFPVAPFLRRQPYGPERSLRRWTLVAGHWRGPADAPVHIGNKVNLVDTPSTKRSD